MNPIIDPLRIEEQWKKTKPQKETTVFPMKPSKTGGIAVWSMPIIKRICTNSEYLHRIQIVSVHVW